MIWVSYPMVSTSLIPNTGVKILYKHSKPCRKKSEVAKNLVKVEKIFLKSDNFYIVPYVFRPVKNNGGVGNATLFHYLHILPQKPS